MSDPDSNVSKAAALVARFRREADEAVREGRLDDLQRLLDSFAQSAKDLEFVASDFMPGTIGRDARVLVGRFVARDAVNPAEGDEELVLRYTHYEAGEHRWERVTQRDSEYYGFGVSGKPRPDGA
jgi:hypothetical protein